MLKKLDRYIIKKYLVTFFYSVILFSIIAVVIDFSEKVEKLLSAEIPFTKIITDYYLHVIPWINGLLWPLFALLSVIFFTSRMARNVEIIAILSSRVSYYRIMVPYLIGGVFLAGLHWYGNNYIIPHSTKQKNEFEDVILNKKGVSSKGYNLHFYLADSEKVYLRYYRTTDTSGTTFRYERFTKEGNLDYVIKANKLTYTDSTKMWTLHDYEKRQFQGLNDIYVNGKGEKFDTLFNMTPDDFVQNLRLVENTNTSDLRKFVEAEKRRGLTSAQNMLMEIERRTAEPISIIILTIMGMAIASRKVRGGLGLHLAAGIIIGALFILLSQLSKTITLNLGVNPSYGMWIPNIFFAIITVFLVWKAQK